MSTKIKGKIPGQWVTRTFVEVKGRKDYLCSVCNENIPKGSKHFRYSTFTDQGTARVHLDCITSNKT